MGPYYIPFDVAKTNVGLSINEMLKAFLIYLMLNRTPCILFSFEGQYNKIDENPS